MSTKSHQLENAEIPKLRFREFSDRWDKTEIGRVLKIGGGKDYKHLKSGNVPVFGTGGYMLSVDKVLYSGESVMIGRKGTIDKPFYYNGDFWTVDTLFYTHGFNGITPKFTSYIFQKINWKKYNEASGVPSLSKATIEKIKINIPTSLTEQQKISEFLESTDKWIENLKDQKKSFEFYKKGMIKKILSQEIRFKDDKGKDFPKWAEKKLGEVIECLDHKRKPVKESDRDKMKGNIPYWGANNIMGYVNDFLFDETIILLAEDGGNFDQFETRPIAQISYGKCWVNNHTHVLRAIRERVSNLFLYYSLVHKDITTYVNGGTRSKLNKGDMLKIKLDLPSLVEQEKMANFLTSIDKVIQSKQQQITQAELWKKGLMQGLFV